MLTQLTTLLGLTPNTAPTEDKILEGGNADFADVFARIEADIDRPKAEQNMPDLAPEVEDGTDEISDDESIEVDDLSESAEMFDQIREAPEFSNKKLGNLVEDERIGLLENESTSAQKLEDQPEGSRDVGDVALLKNQANTVVSADPESWVRRAQMPFDSTRSAKTPNDLQSHSFVGENQAPAPPNSMTRPEVRIQETHQIHQPNTSQAIRSPKLQSNVPTAIRDPFESDLARVETISKPATSVASDPLQATIRTDRTPIRNEKIGVSDGHETLEFSSVQRQPVAELAVSLKQPMTDEPSLRSDDPKTTLLRARQSVSTQDFSVTPQEKIQTGMLIRESILHENVSTARPELFTSDNSVARNAGVDVQHAIERKTPATPNAGVANAPTAPKPLLNLGDDVTPPIERKQDQPVEQESVRASSQDQKDQKLEIPKALTTAAAIPVTDAKQDVRVKAAANMSAVLTQDSPAPLELNPRPETTELKPSDQKLSETTSPLQAAGRISTPTVEKSSDMRVFGRQIQPQPEPRPNSIGSEIRSSEILDEVKTQTIAHSTQDNTNRLLVPEPIERIKEAQRTGPWSERPLRETHWSEQPTIAKTRSMENAIAVPQNKLAQPIPYIQASSVNYPFLAVGEEEQETLEIALQATSSDLRGQQSTHIAPGSNAPVRPDPAMIMRQVADGIQKLSEAGGVELRLSPEELGSVRMQFIQGESGLTVHINAERPETLDLLRRHIDQLAKDLAESGFDSAGFSFGDENTKGQQHKAGSARLDGMPEDSVPTERLVAHQGLDGLDIRV